MRISYGRSLFRETHSLSCLTRCKNGSVAGEDACKKSVSGGILRRSQLGNLTLAPKGGHRMTIGPRVTPQRSPDDGQRKQIGIVECFINVQRHHAVAKFTANCAVEMLLTHFMVCNIFCIFYPNCGDRVHCDRLFLPGKALTVGSFYHSHKPSRPAFLELANS